MSDLVIISLHEKGFWQADFYRDASHISAMELEAMGLSPDDFFTLSCSPPHNLEIDATRKAHDRWPGAEIRIYYGEEDDDDE